MSIQRQLLCSSSPLPASFINEEEVVRGLSSVLDPKKINNSLTPKTAGAIKKASDFLDQTKDTKRVKTSARKLLFELNQMIGCEDVLDPDSHVKRKKALKESPWLKNVYIDFNRFVTSEIDPSEFYVNFDHLEGFEVNSSKQLAGWHWKNPLNPNRSLIEASTEVINLETGVSVARFVFELDGKLKKKDSIFFPESIQTKEQLLAVFSSFKVTHISKNHFLGIASLDHKEVILAGFFDRALDQFSSIFPIFRLIELKGDNPIVALRKTEYKKDPDLELSLDPSVVRDKIKVIAQEQLKGLRKSIRFMSDCGSEFFVEISKEFLPPLGCPLTTGVLIYFKKDEVDHETQGLLDQIYKHMREENLICGFSKLSL